MEIQSSIDNIKKGRILTLALVVSLSILIFKVTQSTDVVNPLSVILRGFGYFIVTYIGLVWAFRFQVTLHSLLYILPQSSLFIFTQVIFFELFFFRRVGRVYEVLILLVMLLLLFLGSYVVFLMSNVFNVATIKEIPLIHAARTVSLLSTLIATFFITLGLLDANFGIILTFLLISIVYILNIFFYLKHTEVNRDRVGVYVLLTYLFMIVPTISLSFVSQRHELVALAPTVGGFIALEIISKRHRNMLTLFNRLQYIVILIIIFVLGLSL